MGICLLTFAVAKNQSNGLAVEDDLQYALFQTLPRVSRLVDEKQAKHLLSDELFSADLVRTVLW